MRRNAHLVAFLFAADCVLLFLAALAIVAAPSLMVPPSELLAQTTPSISSSNTITWEGHPDATGYEILVVATGAGVAGTPVVSIADHVATGAGTISSTTGDATLSGAALYANPDLSLQPQDGVTYDLHVRARDGSSPVQFGPWSAAFTFVAVNPTVLTQVPGNFGVN